MRLDRLAKRLRAADRTKPVLAALGAGYIRLCARTSRWETEGREGFETLVRSGRPFIAASWHGRLFFSPLWAPEGRRALAMISNNNDGDLIAGVVARFGVGTVRGSTADPRKRRKDKGAREAFVGGMQALREGAVLGVTPDGPRGPRMRAQAGVAALSALAGVPVAPLAFSSRRGRLLESWDRFLLPRPFDRVVMLYGPPIEPPASSGPEAVEAHRRAVEEALTALTAEADRRAGRPPVPPDPEPVA